VQIVRPIAGPTRTRGHLLDLAGVFSAERVPNDQSDFGLDAARVSAELARRMMVGLRRGRDHGAKRRSRVGRISPGPFGLREQRDHECSRQHGSTYGERAARVSASSVALAHSSSNRSSARFNSSSSRPSPAARTAPSAAT